MTVEQASLPPMTDGPGKLAKGRANRIDWADHTASDRPSSAVGQGGNQRSLLKVAADLRETARRLVMQAQVIEAGLLPEAAARSKQAVALIDPRTGKQFAPGGRRRAKQAR